MLAVGRAVGIAAPDSCCRCAPSDSSAEAGASLFFNRFVDVVKNPTESVLRYISYVSHRSNHHRSLPHHISYRAGLRQSAIMVINESSKESPKQDSKKITIYNWKRNSKDSSPPRAGKVLLTGK